mmetsp:Transcript_68644/g.128049  ORF Transcript_68644/g.128049 Transcript_68644/m.128049 type:complete len:206 (-) Transcript_68644:75-692(-)
MSAAIKLGMPWRHATLMWSRSSCSVPSVKAVAPSLRSFSAVPCTSMRKRFGGEGLSRAVAFSGCTSPDLALFAGRRPHLSSAVDPNAEIIELHFKLRDGSRKTVSVPSGTTVLEAAHSNEVELEGACEASCACSTCHVILSQEVYDKLPTATDEEEDLLDLAPGLTSTSRLGCQVIIDEKLKGAEVELPKLTLNFYVDGHVPTPH